ncbi:MAG: hypothetical protein IJB76_06190 [Clostridia bacterium]|nr:hypothetical protein [Clostridia bacterium]
MKRTSLKRTLAFFIACIMVFSTCLTVAINADFDPNDPLLEWDYRGEGTGMPDPNDPNEGLPYPGLDGVADMITEYAFKYAPTVYGYGEDGLVDMTTPITSVKAGDVIWVKIACTDIDSSKLEGYDGFYNFEGFFTYNVERIKRFFAEKEVVPVRLTDGTPFIIDSSWLKNFVHVSYVDGMAEDYEVEIQWANIIDEAHPNANQAYSSGHGQHFSVAINNLENGTVGIVEDEQFYLCVPLLVDPDAVQGEEFTFTVPYPEYEEMALGYYFDDYGYVVQDELFGRGGAYTITIDNHGNISANLASEGMYAMGPTGVDLGEYTEGFLNDLRIPYTEKSDYVIFDKKGAESYDIDFLLAQLSTVNGIEVTFNDTADASLPTKVEAYGTDAKGNTVLLGEATSGTAYNEGVTDSANFGSSNPVVNAANAYKYVIDGIDAAKYTNVTIRIYGEDIFAVGEVAIQGEAAKVAVTIENGTIEGATADNLYLPGTVLTITADAIDHKVFADWSATNSTDAFVDAEASTTTYTVGNVDDTITANYDDVYYAAKVENGKFEDGSTENEFVYGTEVGIVADEPAENKVFDRWVVSGDAVVADPESENTTVTINGEATITATYKDTCTLAVTNGTGSGTYLPGEDVEVSANAPEDGYVFYKWEVVSGDVVIADAMAADTTVTVNSNSEIKAVYVWAYKDVPENLVTIDTPVAMIQGSSVSGSVDYTKDQLYPLLSDGKWLVATDDVSVMLSYDLGAAYDVSEVVINFSSLEGFTYSDNITIYGANHADLSDKVVIADTALANLSEQLSFEDGIELTANSGLFKVSVNDTAGYRYIIVEMSTDFNFSHPTYGSYQNSQIAIGEVEIYGTPARFNVDIIGGTSELVSGDMNEDGYTEGSIIKVIPDETLIPGDTQFEKWTADVGEVAENEGEYTYVVNSDATITAEFTEINMPVPENLVPGSTVTLTAGTEVDGFEYIKDQLYPMTNNAYWSTFSPDNNKEITFTIDLGDYYDIDSVSLTAKYGDYVAQTQLPQSITIKGANDAEGTGAVVIGTATGCLDESAFTKLEFADFGVDSDLETVACKYDITTSDVSYRYLIITLSTEYASTVAQYFPNPDVVIGEIEVYGEESMYEVTTTNGVINGASSDNLYNDGDQLSITAPEVEHKTFDKWIVDGEGFFSDENSAETTFVVGNGDAVITAVYEDIYYNLVVENGTGDGEYVFGSRVEITADDPADPELVFSHWEVVGDATVADVNNPQTTVTTGTDSTIKAIYKDRVYLLTVENGTGSGDYAKGTEVTVVADAPAAHKVFSHWEVVTGECTIADANSAETVVTTSNEATTIRAIYADVLYNVTVENGEGSGEYVYGTVVEIVANDPDDHKVFAGWVIKDGEGTITDASSATTTITVEGDVTVEATYADVKYSVTVENGEGSGEYIYGEEIDLVATAPGENYIFSGWEVVEGEIDIDDATAEETTAVVAGDATVKATWTHINYIEVINGKVENAKDYYLDGEKVTIIADAAEEGYEFDKWVIVEGEGTLADEFASKTELTIDSTDVVVRAEYKAVEVTPPTPPTGDSGLAAFAVFAVVSAIGFAVATKKNKK